MYAALNGDLSRSFSVRMYRVQMQALQFHIGSHSETRASPTRTKRGSVAVRVGPCHRQLRAGERGE